MVGLLTYSKNLSLPLDGPSKVAFSNPISEITAAGTVADFHGIPS